mgnify:CR=1 FL=1|tara:strand:+ start:8525 stop:11716 length:3192 start_codon:yes stop_codon:yes gene_type:complete
MNITQQPFAPWVTEQINTRQRSLGNSTNLTTTNLLYQNSKTPWLRLASSVNINQSPENDGVFNKLLNLGFDGSQLRGDNVARNFILQGGVSKIVSTQPDNFVELPTNTGTPNFGLNSKNELFNGAYGWGGLDQRGYVPMPGILGADVKYYKSGALSKATIKMKCFSRNQLALMDVLYMRPGYNLLLEFGWSQYLDNEGNLQTFDNFFSPALSFVFDPYVGNSSSPNHYDVLNLIQKERYARRGNYEGVFGKVSNFKWSFNPDGSYDCSVDLTGMGDMMESLKCNIKLPSNKDDDQSFNNGAVGSTDQPPLIANKNKTTLNKVLYNLYEQTSGDRDNDTYWNVKLPNFPLVDSTIDSDGNVTTVAKREDITIKKGMLSIQDTTTDEDNNESPQVYITFGTFIAIIQKYLLVYNNEQDKVPLFSFDIDFKNIEKDENYIVKIPGQFSANPLVCLIPYTGVNLENITDIKYPETATNNTMSKISTNWDYQTYLGRLAHIYLNINNIATILNDSPREEDGSLSLLSFLNSVMDSFTASLGGINLLSIKVDEVTGQVKFLENSPQRFDNEPPNQTFARLNTFGVKPDTEGSIVRNIVMGGELGPKYASLIVIGSQISGNKLSANATGFAAYNRGLEDRVIKQKVNADYDEGDTEEEVEASEEEQISDLWNNQIHDEFIADSFFDSLFENIYDDKDFLNEDIKCLEELLYNYLSLISGKLVKDKQLQSPSFLPFNLSLDIDGLSGIKLFEKFLIDDAVLPPSYGEGNVDLMVSALNHTVSPASWITQIDTQASPHSKMSKVSSPTTLKSKTTKQKSAGGEDNYGAGAGEGDDFSLTSGFPLEAPTKNKKIYWDVETPKKQIYVHHTAGHTKSPGKSIAGWAKRTDHVATHYITNNLGDKEQVFADEYWANHLGIPSSTFNSEGIPYQNLNKVSLGIEMQAMGPLKLKNGKYYTYPSNFNNGTISEDRVARPVDKNGNPSTYKGYSYYEKYNAANIAHVKTIITGWMSKYGIPFVYDYDVLFPNRKPLSKAALSGTPGVYTHNSVRTGKSDVFPQAELITMFKSIATTIR